ncbi:MAG: DNA translocase FtsK 4TM domain-containing protein [Sphingobacteriaceae bacterium]|nr:DNA translocase FtsK 4TM domain-containing protein [Sphingobacteriaceae bacterium]
MRNEPKKANQPKKEAAKSTAKRFEMPNFSEMLSGNSLRNIIGFSLLLFTTLLAVSMISYLFTWKHDQSQVTGSAWSFLFSSETEVDNWLGRLGAWLAHTFVYRGFGLASFFIVFLLAISTLRLIFADFKVNLLRQYYHNILLLLSISISFGYLFNHLIGLAFPWGGEFGLYLSRWLSGFVGSLGTGLLVLVFWAIYVTVRLNLSLKLADILPNKQVAELEADEVPQASVNIQRTVRPQAEEISPTIDLNEPLDTDELDEDEAPWSDEMEPHLVTTPPPAPAPSPQTLEITPPIEEAAPTGPALEIEEVIEEDILAEGGVVLNESELYDPKLDLSSYKYPPIDLLVEHGSSKVQINAEELEKNKNQIIETLGHYNIEIDKIRATVGPTVTLYEIVPAAGVRISKIKNLEDDIALSLAALGIRIIAPMPGKGTIGIEVPNQHKEIVSMRSLLASEKFVNSDMELPVALGKTISNEIFITDLAKMPHLLMAGATGQGKSVGLNAILVSLLYKRHPSELKFVLVDPKKVELSLFKHIERHFLAKLPGTDDAIITDTMKVVDTMNSLCIEMDKRYDLLKDAQVRNLMEYNAKFRKRKLNPNNGHRFLPYIVVVIDEFADLIMTAGKEIETPIARLAQLARAVGIHLIVATQRPSVNIITGTIKANFPARIGFKVSSKIDSRTILDAGGAEQLIGRGDMLLSLGSSLIRLQCAFVDTPEVEAICEYIGGQRGYPDAFLLPEYSSGGDEGGGLRDMDPNDRDALFEDAARVIVQNQQGSTSLLQRRMKLGYNRAGRLIDQLEAAGVVGPFEGSKAREVLIPDEYALEQLLNRMNEK